MRQVVDYLTRGSRREEEMWDPDSWVRRMHPQGPSGKLQWDGEVEGRLRVQLFFPEAICGDSGNRLDVYSGISRTPVGNFRYRSGETTFTDELIATILRNTKP
ncbi:hypothetical protein BDV09DRAFT_183838 [Aspergillus tetrazonus]